MEKFKFGFIIKTRYKIPIEKIFSVMTRKDGMPNEKILRNQSFY